MADIGLGISFPVLQGSAPVQLAGLSPPHRRARSSSLTWICALALVGGSVAPRPIDAHGLQRHSISVVSQCSTDFSSQPLPTICKPDGKVTWMRNGTFGSDVCSGNAPDGTT